VLKLLPVFLLEAGQFHIPWPRDRNKMNGPDRVACPPTLAIVWAGSAALAPQGAGFLSFHTATRSGFTASSLNHLRSDSICPVSTLSDIPTW
jgi:hypothetical protein